MSLSQFRGNVNVTAKGSAHNEMRRVCTVLNACWDPPVLRDCLANNTPCEGACMVSARCMLGLTFHGTSTLCSTTPSFTFRVWTQVGTQFAKRLGNVYASTGEYIHRVIDAPPCVFLRTWFLFSISSQVQVAALRTVFKAIKVEYLQQPHTVVCGWVHCLGSCTVTIV